MKIVLIANDNSYLSEIIHKALIRSFTPGQVVKIRHDEFSESDASFYFLVNPEDYSDAAEKILKSPAKKKLLVCGRISDSIARRLGLKNTGNKKLVRDIDSCPPAPVYSFSQSPGLIRYRNHPLTDLLYLKERPLCRYDFAEEWNNMGYGRIGTDDSVWSISQVTAKTSSPDILASVMEKDKSICPFITIKDDKDYSMLWINREAALVDSCEWIIAETIFLIIPAGGIPVPAPYS